MNAANGEPEYYALIDTIGNLSGYNKCYADTCSVSITAKDVDSAAIFNYFRDDKMGVEFKDVF
ncbi:MAG: hypothetical protein EOP56_08825 [Sphingobacteriales bacterium]|nr:MAG: hypothetical protein EOP56_08825 [Sphingobacteriales bacterium]